MRKDYRPVEVAVIISVAEDGTKVPGQLRERGMLHIIDDDGTTELSVAPYDRELSADDYGLLFQGSEASLTKQIEAMNATFEQLRADKTAAEAARNEALTAKAQVDAKLAAAAQALG